MRKKTSKKSLQDTVPTPNETLPKPDIGLEELDGASRKIEIAPKIDQIQAMGKSATMNLPPTEKKPKRLSVDLNTELFASFKAWCAIKQTTMKKKVVELIEETIKSG